MSLRLARSFRGNAQLVVGNQNWSTRIQGVWPEYQDIQNWKVSRGAFFSQQDNMKRVVWQ